MSLYHEAAQFLDIKGQSGTLRTILYSKYENDKNKSLKCNPKQVYALVSETLKYKALLSDVIKASGLLKAERKLTPQIALLMCQDLLISKSGRINCGKNPLKEAVLKHKTRLKAELVKYKIKHKIQITSSVSVDDETPVRWIRKNTIKCKEDPLDSFFSEYERVDSIDKLDRPGKIFIDPYVPFLYGIHPSEKIAKFPSYQSGKIIIQDRASCFPATILNPKPGDVLVDSCSAPGNKTTHLASFVGNTPHTITAFERDPRRAEILKKMINMAGAGDCVNVKVGDFTDCDPNSSELSKVVGLVVDPSCSGSGIFGRGFEENDNTENDQADKFRLHKLSNFQFKIVSHAMSFPSAKTVVYSTCSIHAEENEQVVRRLLEDPQVKSQGWRLRLRDSVLPNWPRRGWPAEFEGMKDFEKLGDACVRALPKEDGGIGFFAACFERVDKGEGAEIVEQADAKESTDNSDNEEEWTGFN